MLRRFGVALCVADSEERTTPFEMTAPFGYLRLRREQYDEETLRSWAERCEGAGWDHAFVYFKHEERATGPRFAEQFGNLLGADGSTP